VDPERAHCLSWGFIVAATRLRAGDPEPDPVLLKMMGDVPAALWDPIALRNFVEALVSAEAEVRSTGATALYLNALLPHLPALPNPLRVAICQLRSVAILLAGDPASFAHAASDPNDGFDRDQQRGSITSLLREWRDPSLKGWMLPLNSLVAVLQPLAVAHLTGTDPHRPPHSVARSTLLRRLNQAIGSAPMTLEQRTRLWVIICMLGASRAFSGPVAVESPVGSLVRALRRNLQWFLSRAGGSLPAAWFAEFVAPVCVNLLFDRTTLASCTRWRTTAARALLGIRQQSCDPESLDDVVFTVGGLKDSLSHAVGQPTDAEYAGALSWLVTDLLGLHVEDHTFATGVVGPRPAPLPIPETIDHLAAKKKVLETIYRDLAATAEVDWSNVDWGQRECCRLRSDQLLHMNDTLRARRDVAAGRYSSDKPVFEIQSPPGLCLRDKKALLKQIATFFEASDPAAFYEPTGVAVKRIGNDDRRLGLRGQSGLFCAQAGSGFRANRILGVYAGRLLTKKEYLEQRLPLPAKLQRSRYSFIFEDQQLTVDALESGNQLMLINDYRSDPFAGDESDTRVNTQFVEVLVNGWPHLFVATTEEVKPGEELLMDYGDSYWQGHRLLHDLGMDGSMQHYRDLGDALAPFFA